MIQEPYKSNFISTTSEKLDCSQNIGIVHTVLTLSKYVMNPIKESPIDNENFSMKYIIIVILIRLIFR